MDEHTNSQIMTILLIVVSDMDSRLLRCAFISHINMLFPAIGCAAPVEPGAVRSRRHGDRGVRVSERQSRQMRLLQRRGSPGPNEQPPLLAFLPQE